jgi:hypothetical protein
MKHLSSIISLFAIASLAVLAVASALGVSSPSWSVASRMVGLSWAAGVLAIFVTDYAPRRSCSVSAAVRTAEAQREDVPAKARPLADAATTGVMATLGLANDPATVSLL